MALAMPSLAGPRCARARTRITKVAPREDSSSNDRIYVGTLEQAIRPVIICMKIFGVFHDVSWCRANGTEDEGSSPACPRRKWFLARFATMKTYCVLVVAYQWINLVRFAVGFFPTDNSLVFRITAGLWMLQCGLLLTCLFVGCTKRTHLRAFFQEWNAIFQDEAARTLELKPKYCRKYVIGATIFGWFFFAMTSAGIAGLQWGGSPMGDLATREFSKPFEPSIWIIVLTWVAQIYAIGCWSFLPMFVMCLSHLIKANLDALTELIDKHVSEAERKVPEYLEELRIKHLRMCDAVAILDRNFRYLNAVLYGTGIPLLCFVSYQLATVSMDTITLVVNLFWLLAGISGVIFVSIVMAKVQDAAHAPLDAVFRVQPFNATPEQLGQLTLFLTKLTGTSVGFTVINLLVITKELLLTIGGLYITYFLLLLQFQIK